MRPREYLLFGMALLLVAAAFAMQGGGIAILPSTPLATKGVLIIEEKEDRGKLPSSQIAAMDSAELRGMVTEAGGEWRLIDDDQTMEPGPWADAMKRERTELPWWLVSDGTRGEEGPLPDDMDGMQGVLAKYFGD